VKSIKEARAGAVLTENQVLFCSWMPPLLLFANFLRACAVCPLSFVNDSRGGESRSAKIQGSMRGNADDSSEGSDGRGGVSDGDDDDEEEVSVNPHSRPVAGGRPGSAEHKGYGRGRAKQAMDQDDDDFLDDDVDQDDDDGDDDDDEEGGDFSGSDDF
jgi:hypothetical protein